MKQSSESTITQVLLLVTCLVLTAVVSFAMGMHAAAPPPWVDSMGCAGHGEPFPPGPEGEGWMDDEAYEEAWVPGEGWVPIQALRDERFERRLDERRADRGDREVTELPPRGWEPADEDEGWIEHPEDLDDDRYTDDFPHEVEEEEDR